jgi:hypothetical protein
VHAESCRAATAAGDRVGNDEVDRNDGVTSVDTYDDDPSSGLGMDAVRRGSMKPRLQHRRIYLRVVVQQCRSEHHIAVCGERCNREVVEPGAEIDRLCPDDDAGASVRGECR